MIPKNVLLSSFIQLEDEIEGNHPTNAALTSLTGYDQISA